MPHWGLGQDTGASNAGGTFNLEGAKKAAAAMAPFDNFWFEEPLPFSQPEGFRALAQETQIPLGTGEHFTNRDQVQTYLDTGAIHYFQTEVGTNGGILETIKVAAMAETHGVQISTHDWGGPVLRMAGSHVCAVIPNLIYQEYAALAPTDVAALELLDPPTRVEKGHIVLSDAPGLGFELNENLVAARRVGQGTSWKRARVKTNISNYFDESGDRLFYRRKAGST